VNARPVIFSIVALFSALLAGLAGCSSAPRTKDLSRFDREAAPVLRLYLVRHAEAFKNVPALFRPSGLGEAELDSLTPDGEAQAAALGRYFRDKDVIAVIVSPTGRTRQTGAAICEAAGIAPPLESEAFASIRPGETPGGEPASWSWWTEQWERGEDPRPEGGENLRDLVARTVAGVEELAREYRGDTVVVITHGEVIAALLGHAEATPLLARHREHEVSTGSVSEVELFPAPRWRANLESLDPATE
jgi:probable phosphoglycerate mutase